MKCLYYKHIWSTVPQKRMPNAIYTSKHAVLTTVCQQWTYISLTNAFNVKSSTATVRLLIVIKTANQRLTCNSYHG